MGTEVDFTMQIRARSPNSVRSVFHGLRSVLLWPPRKKRGGKLPLAEQQQVWNAPKKQELGKWTARNERSEKWKKKIEQHRKLSHATASHQATADQESSVPLVTFCECTASTAAKKSHPDGSPKRTPALLCCCVHESQLPMAVSPAPLPSFST